MFLDVPRGLVLVPLEFHVISVVYFCKIDR
jgi:hypothetical protein